MGLDWQTHPHLSVPVPFIESSAAHWAPEGRSISVSLYSEHVSYVVITLLMSETRCSPVLPVGWNYEEAGIASCCPEHPRPGAGHWEGGIVIHESVAEESKGGLQLRADLLLAGLYFYL